MKNRFDLNEEEKNHIRGLHNLNEQSGFSEKQEGSDRLDRFNSRQEMEDLELGEQMVDRVDTLSHEEFMSKVDGYCIKLLGDDGKTGTEETEEDDYDKSVGNKSIKNWSDTEQWVRAYCKGK